MIYVITVALLKIAISWDVVVDAGSLCSKAAVLIVVTEEVLHILSVTVA